MREFQRILGLGLAAIFAWLAVSCSSSTNGGGGGGSTGGAGGTGGTGAIVTECTNSLECASRSDGKTVCSTGVGVCVQCLKATDCTGADGQTQDCIDNACVSFASCINSLDCPKGRVCDRDASRCVECTADADCGGEAGTQRCVANTCRRACASDNNCTPYGLLCNTSGGYCVSCVSNVDCPESRWCNLGTCTLDICVPGATRCDTTGLSTCNSAGSSWGSPVTCGTGRICSTSQGSAACLTQICTPSNLYCATGAEQVMACASDGLTSTLSQDCAAASQVCVSGACKPVICTASARYCDSGVVRTCSAKGDTSSVYSTCSNSQYCDATATTPTCKTRICTANAAVCNGTVATTCNADGSGYVAGGTDCTASDLRCVSGVCKALVCTPSTYFCDSGAVRYCASDGMSSTAYTTCSSTSYCDATTTTPTCKARICTATTPACNGNLATNCNADGSGYVTGGTDCAASGQLCSGGFCANQSIETVGSASSSSSTTYYAKMNLYKVTVARTLTTIEQYLSAPANTVLTWVVFESATQTGTYTSVLSTTTTAASSTAGYASSGTLATPVPLKANYFYAIGVYLGSTAGYTYYYYMSATLPLTTNFGSVVSGMSYYSSSGAPASVSYSSSSSSIYPQRLTLTP